MTELTEHLSTRPQGVRATVLALAAGLLLTACKPETKAPPPPVPEVATVTVQPQAVTLTTELPGRTSAFRVAEIRPQVNGLILKRLFTEGEEVAEGQELYQIDPAQFQAALDNAVAALDRAEANLPALESRAKRYRDALAEKAVSQQLFDDANAALQQGQAEIKYYKAMVQTARINLGYSLVKSPISGRIGVSSVTDGAIVTAYQPLALATIQQLDPIYVDVPQSTTDALRLRQELERGALTQGGDAFQEVELILPDGNPYPLKGKLQFRDVSVDPTTGSVLLRMVFPNPDKVLLPGMFVRTVVKQGVSGKAILLPHQTVSRDPKGNPMALVVGDDGKVQQRQLVVDRVIGDKWMVASGVKPGERVIAEGIQKVRPGVLVKEVPFTTTPHHSPNEAEKVKVATTSASPANTANTH
jgi:membrane fusion protein (multidrug efflux system)